MESKNKSCSQMATGNDNKFREHFGSYTEHHNEVTLFIICIICVGITLLWKIE